MKKYKENFTEDELRQALHANDNKAGELLEDPEKWKRFKDKFDDFLHKSYKIPVLGSVIDDIVSMVQIVDVYIKKEYVDVPWTSLISIVGALIYVLSPVDLIPDVIPFLGYVDDVAVVLFVLGLGVGHDLEKFRSWQEQKREDSIALLEKMMVNAILEILDGDLLGALILCNDNMFRMLSVKGSDNDETAPFDCRVHYLNMPVDILKDMHIEGEEDHLVFLNRVAKSGEMRWSPVGKLAAIHEADFSRYEEFFSLMEEEDE